MSKKSAKKRRVYVPKISREVSNDLYMFRKGEAKRKKSARRIKKIMKNVKQNEEVKEENSQDESIQTSEEEKE